MSEDHRYIAAFDLDKTILTINSSRTVVRKSRLAGFMSRGDIRRALYLSLVYQFDLKDPNDIVASMMQWIKGLKQSEISRMISDDVIPEILPLIRPEIRRELEMHREKKARLVLLSSAIPYLCRPVADHLGMDDVICSELEVSNDTFTGHSVGKLVFSREKASRMREYCRENNFLLEQSWYYGDAYTDRHILKIVGNPVAVKPEMKLRLMALRKGWMIL